MKNKVKIVLIILISIFILFEMLYISKSKIPNIEYNTGSAVYNDNINNQGEYEITNSSKIIGDDIPKGKYRLISKSEGVTIQIVRRDGVEDISNTKVNDKITLKSDDTAIIVSEGSIILK